MPGHPTLLSKRYLCALSFPALLFGSIPVADAATRYVNAAASGTNNGSSWTNAYTDLQAALAAAVSGDQIWVAAGTYKPTTTDRAISFVLKNGVAIYGGFAGGEGTLAQRDPAAHPTILSGDIGTASNASDNSYHVVSSSGTDNSAVLDGFTLTGGNANGSGIDYDNFGGGINNVQGNPTLKNLMVSNNTAQAGGGMASVYGSPTLVNVTFSGNGSSASGGGMHHTNNSYATLINVAFSGNNAGTVGGAITNAGASALNINNSIFWGNAAPSGAQIYSPTISDPSYLTINNSIVQGGYPAAAPYVTSNNVLEADPLFVNAAGGDLHLQPGSPAIDAGNNAWLPAGVTTDLDNLPRIVNGTVDMGPYEKQLPPVKASIDRKPLWLSMLLGLLGLAVIRRRLSA